MTQHCFATEWYDYRNFLNISRPRVETPTNAFGEQIAVVEESVYCTTIFIFKTLKQLHVRKEEWQRNRLVSLFKKLLHGDFLLRTAGGKTSGSSHCSSPRSEQNRVRQRWDLRFYGVGVSSRGFQWRQKRPIILSDCSHDSDDQSRSETTAKGFSVNVMRLTSWVQLTETSRLTVILWDSTHWRSLSTSARNQALKTSFKMSSSFSTLWSW